MLLLLIIFIHTMNEIAVQNIIFGQLGAMAFTMHEIGLPRDKVPFNLLIFLFAAF